MKRRIQIALWVLLISAGVFPVVASAVTIDSTTSTTVNDHKSQPALVFTSDTVGYMFYKETTGTCGYSKTTDSGSSWGSYVAITAQTDCTNIAVWYDQWTPGDTTGTVIHIVFHEIGTDDVFYDTFDTSGDSNGTEVAVNAVSGTLTNIDSISITKATNNALYIGLADNSTNNASKISVCFASCAAGSNWANAGTSPLDNRQADFIRLMPGPSGDVMLIRHDISADVIDSKIYASSTATWAGSWTTIDGSAADSTTYLDTLSATIDRKTGDIYLAYVEGAGGGSASVQTAVWTASNTTWTNTVSTGVISSISTSLAFDENTGNVFVFYTDSSSPGVVRRVSTDGLSTLDVSAWGTVLSVTTPRYVTANMMSNQRIYVAVSEDATNDGIFGVSVSDLTPPTYVQSNWKLFNNTDSTDVGSALAATNTVATLSSAGSAFRFRALLHITTFQLSNPWNIGGVRVGLENFKLQYVGKGGGTCASPSGGTPSSYTDVTGSTLIAFNNNPTPSDGDALTENVGDPIHTSTSEANHSYEELNTFTNIVKIPTSYRNLWDFSLIDNGAPTNTAYCFRIVKEDGTTLSFSAGVPYAQVTTASVSAPTVATNAASSITAVSAQLNGNITATGGSNATVRGFAWGTSSTLQDAFGTSSETGSFSTGTFLNNVSGLVAGTRYYFRAYATNPTGTGYGSITFFDAGTNTTPTRKMRLFEGFNLKLLDGRLLLYQN